MFNSTSGFIENGLKRVVHILGLVLILTAGPLTAWSSAAGGDSRTVPDRDAERQSMIDQLEELFGPGPDMQIMDVEGRRPIRCMLPYQQMYEEVGDDLSPATRRKMDEMLSVSDDEEDLEEFISESGKFRILYTTSGRDSIPVTYDLEPGDYGLEPDNVPPDYVLWTAEYADSSYRHQVERLGFVDPTVRHGSGECREWEGQSQDTVITIRYENISDRYGTFEPSSPFAFKVHNNFDGFPPNDIEENQRLGSLQVTIAHEFKHVIQYATNCMSGDAGRGSWVEMDATMMENIVHPDVNDYYNYITGSNSIFHRPEYSIPATWVYDSYGHVTWFLFFAEKYGMDFWVDVWEQIHGNHRMPMVTAMSYELMERDHDFETALIRNHLWHLTSGDRSLAEDTMYGFSEREAYPDAATIPGYHDLPAYLGMEADVPLRAARYFEFNPEAEGVTGPVGLIQLYDHASTGMGFLAKKKNGEIEELVVPSSGAGPLKLALPLEWEEIAWLGVVNVNSNTTTPVLSQFFAGVGEQTHMERLYGDVTFSGDLADEDASGLLQFKMDPSSATMFHRNIGDVSGNGALTHYDASYVYRHLDGDFVPFPADDDGSGLALKWDDEVEVVDGNQGMVYPAAKQTTAEEVSDTVSVELRLDTEQAVADQPMDLVLSVSGATDVNWHSLYLELAIDYPGSGSTGGEVGLMLEDIMGYHHTEGLGDRVYDLDEHILRIAYASSVPFSTGDDPVVASVSATTNFSDGDLLLLRLIPQNDGDIRFRVSELELDEHTYVVIPDTIDIDVMTGVYTERPEEKPLEFALEQNYPNPFNPETTIAFTLPESGPVTLELYDITGRRVATLLDRSMDSGRHTVRFDARNHTGLASGVYLYRLQSPSRQSVRKMTILK